MIRDALVSFSVCLLFAAIVSGYLVSVVPARPDLRKATADGWELAPASAWLLMEDDHASAKAQWGAYGPRPTL